MNDDELEEEDEDSEDFPHTDVGDEEEDSYYA